MAVVSSRGWYRRVGNHDDDRQLFAGCWMLDAAAVCWALSADLSQTTVGHAKDKALDSLG